MIEFITMLIVLIIVLCVRVYRKTKILAAKERDYIDEQRMFHNRKTCRIYDAAKLILVLILYLHFSGDRGDDWCTAFE